MNTSRPAATPWTAGRRNARLRLVGSTAALAGAIAVAGCSGEDLAESFVENRIEAESGQDVDLDVDLDGGGFRVETDEGTFEMNTDADGNLSISGDGVDGEVSIDSDDGVTVIESEDGTATFDAGGTGVPDDFPDSVPLPDRFEPEFSQSMSTSEGNGWVLGGPVAMTAAEIADSYFAALEDAGFERSQVTETSDSVIFGFADGEYSVSGLAGGDGSGETFFNVTVAEIRP